MRYAELERNTRETQIKMSLALDNDGNGILTGGSGLGFFDHMLNSFAVHGGFSITLEMNGDLKVDGHHSVEDAGIVLGKLFHEILKDKSGIKRFGHCYVPMDEALGFAAVDISGRAYLVFDAAFDSEKIGDYDTQLTREFFRALAYNAQMTLHIRALYGSNDHHKTESIFKSSAKAISEAVTLNGGNGVLSAKGVL